MSQLCSKTEIVELSEDGLFKTFYPKVLVYNIITFFPFKRDHGLLRQPYSLILHFRQWDKFFSRKPELFFIFRLSLIN